MRKPIIAITILSLLLLCACGASTADTESVGTPSNVSNVIEETAVPVIYADNDKINAFIIAYNETYPEDAITSDNISKYYHHGREHDNQIKTQIAGYPVIISGEGITKTFNASVYWDNPTPAGAQANHDLFCRIEHILSPNLTDSEIEARWEELIKEDGVVESWDDGTEISCGYGNSDGSGKFPYMKLHG